jgi:eukaryotic-like serine/threonine-protein kinase
MASQQIDRDLLFGLVALETRFIDRAELLEALEDWVKDETRSLAEVLESHRSLTGVESTLVDAVIDGKAPDVDDELERRFANLLAADTSAPATVKERALRFQVVWAHAKGGLGEVFLAQDTELNRRVALKEIQAKHANDPVSRRRFLAEAEITGNLEHPGVVPVYGLGTYPDGRPFYAMRFIKGEDLASAIRKFHSVSAPAFTGLEFRRLLRKLIDVCHTVAYAHSRGVLHRDLKPGNVMIGPFGETLVMDWGVAKLIGGSEGGEILAREQLFTESDEAGGGLDAAKGAATLTGYAVGTPAYMSPEQAAGRLDALGPASDVYSLGATLYVMLTGRAPFQGTVNDVLAMVRAGKFVAARRHKPQVPEALDAICRCAMALCPGERYQSAMSLAADIERWLADEPVTAWREPWPDQTRRWVRRHQPLVVGWAAAVGVALLALSVAVPLLSLAWRNALAARRSEERQRIVASFKAQEANVSKKRANEERVRAEHALRFLVEAFRRPDPSMDGRALKVVDLLDHAANELDRSVGDEPLARATLLNAIGETYNGLGLHREGLAVFQRALSVRREQLGDNDPATLASMNSLAMAYHDVGRLDLAIPILSDTLEKRRNALGGDHPDTIETMNDLAVAFWETGQAERAIPLYESILVKVRATLGDDHADTLTIMDNLAVAYGAAGHHDKAIAHHEAIVTRFQAKLGADHISTLVAMNNLAKAYQRSGRVRESIQLHEETLARLRAKLGDDHPTTLVTMNGLAQSYRLAGELARATTLLEATWAGRRVKLGCDHPDTVTTVFALAQVYMATGQRDKAVPLARAFLDKTAELGARLPADVRADIPRAAKMLEMAADARANP